MTAGDLALFGLADGVLKTDFPAAHVDLIISAAFSPNGSTLATGGADERVVQWEVKRWVPIRTNQSDFINVSSVVFTPDSQTLFASSWDQNLRSWSLGDATQPKIWHGHSGGINRLAAAPDGDALISASSDMAARVSDVA